jgi:hypothetical protein
MRNCPVCGAENEVDARFCAECGAPLDDEDNEATIVGRVAVFPGPEEEDESDQTILSTSFRSLEEAETMAFDKDQVAEAQTETPAPGPPSFPPEPDADSPPVSAPPPPVRPVVEVPPPPTGSGAGGPPPGSPGGRKTNWPLIAGIIIAVLLICCCCCSLLVGSSIASDPDTMDDILRELGAFVPHVLTLV